MVTVTVKSLGMIQHLQSRFDFSRAYTAGPIFYAMIELYPNESESHAGVLATALFLMCENLSDDSEVQDAIHSSKILDGVIEILDYACGKGLFDPENIEDVVWEQASELFDFVPSAVRYADSEERKEALKRVLDLRASYRDRAAKMLRDRDPALLSGLRQSIKLWANQ